MCEPQNIMKETGLSFFLIKRQDKNVKQVQGNVFQGLAIGILEKQMESGW